MNHVLVTNDFPPKTGGIQSYLWELWRRLDPKSFTVLTAGGGDAEARAFDAAQPFAVERLPLPALVPGSGIVRRDWSVVAGARDVICRTGARLAVLDPALPIGLIGPRLGVPYAVILHGAEVTVPARLPVGRKMLRHVLGGAALAICAGTYPEAEARRAAGALMPRVVQVPPGVDTARFTPLTVDERAEARARFGLPPAGRLVVSVSRLVPRKGMDVLIDAAAGLQLRFDDLTVAIAGSGRDRARLAARIARDAAPVRLLGEVSGEDLPLLYGAADVFAMACRSRWAGYEQEGFGIVFLEAAAVGVPQVAGASGGASEAVVDGRTGLVVSDPRNPHAVAHALARLLDDERLRTGLGASARARAVEEFDYERLSNRLATALADTAGGVRD